MSGDRRRARAGAALALLALLGGTAACGTGAPAEAAPATSSAPSGTPADPATGRIAEVEFARQCTVASANFADEAGFTTDLDARLATAGFTHEQWKQWHDALDDSPALVAQFAAVSAAGCPPG
ncbi:hypothetical protein GCU56_13970 [Geodermatophilus sabuli]|uniref:DUF732 domain-containing protein n=1 Tax=Geodermatophilus sabuli TaxID=1564158 RepID=A0A7K3W467_9ACTN|nr:hypothetical protein [Geodermatophilus sabuli]NEK58974.1 hypothetical protein [Geodermatophilus sabuli]